MNERVAQIVLLVRAFEEADRTGRVVPGQDRAAATRRAVMVTTSVGAAGSASRGKSLLNEETVTRRARVLYRGLRRKIPALPRVLEFARLRSLMGPAFFALATAVGLGTSFAGPRGRISILDWPLLVLVGWNLAIYGWTFVGPLVAQLLGRPSGNIPLQPHVRGARRAAWSHGLTGLVVRFALWRSRIGWRRRSGGDADVLRVIDRGVVRFCALWHRLTRPLLESRVRRRLHLGAIALAAGMVGGIWFRGTVLEHPVFWDSRLLEARHVQAVLSVLLGPASVLTGHPVPDVIPLRWPGSGDPRPWVELYAVTAAVFVFFPRGVLVLFEALRGLRLKRALTLDYGDAYYRHALADWRGATRRIEVIPCGHHPLPATLAHVRGLLQDFFGAQAEMRVGDRLGLAGGAAAESELARALARCPEERDLETYVVVLFDLADDPRSDVERQFLTGLRQGLERRGCRIVVLCDGSAYRVHESLTACAERQRKWDAIVGAAGLRAVHIDGNRAYLDRRVAHELGASLAARSAVPVP